MSQDVIPRDAASILVYRLRCAQIQVLIGRRPASASFMPGVYVFPGGGVEPCDAKVQTASSLDVSLVSHMGVDQSVSHATTLANAAIRETFEETGLEIALPGNPGHTADPSWQYFEQQGIAPHLAVLRFLGTATTPPNMSKRFHARFFLCDADSIEGLSEAELKGNGELEDLRWVSLPDMQNYSMRSVTVHMLEQFSTIPYARLQRYTGSVQFN